MRLVLIGDGESPHLLKWARALAQQKPAIELWAASTRGFAPEFSFLLPEDRRLALNTRPAQGGGNMAVLAQLPRLGAWLKRVQPDWLHAHYLTSHGTLAWAAKRGWGLRARIASSAWGSDILVAPQQGWAYRWLTQKVLRESSLCSSDSAHMSERMRELGAAEVMTFPFGLESLPKQNARKNPWQFFANRGLEPIYQPQRVIEVFRGIAARQPEARLIVANDGSLRAELEAAVARAGLAERVQFVGRLDPSTQGRYYAQSRWYLSLPRSDSASVSVLEAMAHECLPLLSDLPANHELLRLPPGAPRHGLILPEDMGMGEGGAQDALLAAMQDLTPTPEAAAAAGAANRAWVAEHAMFGPAVQRFVQRLREIQQE